MSNPQDLKQALIKALAEKGEYSTILKHLSGEEKEEKETKKSERLNQLIEPLSEFAELMTANTKGVLMENMDKKLTKSTRDGLAQLAGQVNGAIDSLQTELEKTLTTTKSELTSEHLARLAEAKSELETKLMTLAVNVVSEKAESLLPELKESGKLTANEVDEIIDAAALSVESQISTVIGEYIKEHPLSVEQITGFSDAVRKLLPPERQVTWESIIGKPQMSQGGTNANLVQSMINNALNAFNNTPATLENKTLTSPKINEDVELTATSTELNYLANALGPDNSGLTITNATPDNTISVVQNGNVGNAVATDGAIHINNTGNTGIGLGVYTNIGAEASAPLISILANNSAFDQTVMNIVNAGNGTGVYIEQNGTLGASQRAFEVRVNSVLDDGTKFGISLYSNTIHTSTTSALMRIINDHASATNRCINIQQDAANIAVFLDMNGNERAMFIDHDDAGTQPSVRIDRDGNNAGTVTALDIQVDNAGSGTVLGIDFSTMSVGEWAMKFPTDNNDPTSGGGAATGRIAINIAGATRYIPYY